MPLPDCHHLLGVRNATFLRQSAGHGHAYELGAASLLVAGLGDSVANWLCGKFVFYAAPSKQHTLTPFSFGVDVQAVFVFVMTDLGATKFGDYIFPEWADAMGWMMGASTLAPLVIFAVIHLLRKPKVSEVWFCVVLIICYLFWF